MLIKSLVGTQYVCLMNDECKEDRGFDVLPYRFRPGVGNPRSVK